MQMFDCVIVGGGIAGLQAAIQLGRYRHQILVIDSNQGRSTLCRCYHNLLGWPDGVSGIKLRQIGYEQAKSLGVQFVMDDIQRVQKVAPGFQLQGQHGTWYAARRLLIATGIVDRIPLGSELLPCMGMTAYVCPDCDGYEITGRATIVLGAGDSGAEMALTLTHWSNRLIYVNHETIRVDESLLRQLHENGVQYIDVPIRKVLADDNQFRGVLLENGCTVFGERAFIAFGGNCVKSTLADQLGARLMENRHIEVDPRTKMTSIPNVWAAGDVVAHSEQVTIAMGDGSQAAIWIHKSLLDATISGS